MTVFFGTVLIFIGIYGLMRPEMVAAIIKQTNRTVTSVSAAVGGIGILVVLMGAHL